MALRSTSETCLLGFQSAGSGKKSSAITSCWREKVGKNTFARERPWTRNATAMPSSKTVPSRSSSGQRVESTDQHSKNRCSSYRRSPDAATSSWRDRRQLDRQARISLCRSRDGVLFVHPAEHERHFLQLAHHRQR